MIFASMWVLHYLLKASRPINFTQYSMKSIALVHIFFTWPYVKSQYVGKQEISFNNNLQTPPNQNKFYAKDWLKEKILGSNDGKVTPNTTWPRA